VVTREMFFELSTDDVACVITLDAHLDTGESLFFWVRRIIVNRVIGDLLFDSTESDRKVEAALSIFIGNVGLERREEPALSNLSSN
jgi:hypothetical protein